MSVSADFNNVIKKYGNTAVIENLNLQIKKGEFFTLLGPSGCGKTTLLRMVAGFNSIEGGEILIADKPINATPAHKRNMGMVFQNYAIFPHLSVFNNVAYGLKARNFDKKIIEEKVTKALQTMQIEHLRDRVPKNMSGGQQQRVALARAIIIEPTMLLMDEPLSNLDAKLRIDMRLAIKKIQREVGITTIYVTHDQEEALAISDRIAVMDKGIIQQIDKPLNLYTRPQNIFVATFIGHTNVLMGVKEDTTIRLDNGYSFSVDNLMSYNGKVQIGVRPENFVVQEQDQEGIKGLIKLVTFLGQFVQYQVQLEDGQEIKLTQNITTVDSFMEIGSTITMQIQIHAVNVFDESGETLFINSKDA